MNAPFDTLKLAQGMQSTGMDPAMAHTIVEALSTAMAEADFATKSDLKHEAALLRSEMAELRTEMRSEMASLRTEMRSEMSALRTEMKGDMAVLRTELKSDMAVLSRDLTIKLGALMGTLYIGGLGLIVAAIRFLPHP